MTPSLSARLDRALEGLPRAYPGPGGAVAALKDGEVIARHAWGFANAERRIPFTPATLFRICSITKQFTCAAVLDAFPDPAVLDGEVRARLPLLKGEAPGALHLMHNQSGLRDYWALGMLHGSPAEAPFGDAEAAAIISGTRSLQFAPGARYSYANNNFRLLGDMVAARAGAPLAQVLRRRIFDPAGMPSAILAADTSAMPDGTEGYEGSVEAGFRPAVNRILWTGDAGMGASLDDMIAWERWIDATREDADALYSRLSAPVTFAGGAPTTYGFGLGRGEMFGRAVTSHGGGLRGWRSHRLYMRSERVSVVVMFNHMARADLAAEELVAAVLGEARPEKPAAVTAVPEWLGAYADPETGLAARIEAAAPGQVRLRFGHPPEELELQADGTAGTSRTRLAPGDGGLVMERPQENFATVLAPRTGEAARDIAGRYRCAELEAEIAIADAGGALFGAFSGFLGTGRMEQLAPIGADLWALPCPRALDFTPPGDWTLNFRRDPGGRITSATVGCWLARGLEYERVG